jgi:hypothetical protein
MSALVAISSETEVLKSICSRTAELRSGSSPTPEIFLQPVSFNTFSELTASIDSRTPLISQSFNFDAKTLSITPKSSVSESKHAGREIAEAIIARDGMGRYSPINRKIESGRMLI